MIVLLYNPLSKNRKSKRVTKRLVDRFKKQNVPFRVKSLLKIKDMENYISKSAEDITFILLGGDGTINTFINNTMRIPLTHDIFIKPTGSGNDFLRSLRRYHPKRQYIMEMQHDDDSRYFVNGSGFGMDGVIAHRVNQSKRKNRFRYLYHTVRTFFSYKPSPLKVTLDGEPTTFDKAYLININNGAYIGGGMKLTPKARLDENKLDVLIVHHVSKIVLLFIFLSVYLGFHTIFTRYITYTKANEVIAESDSPQTAQCDGETFEGVRRIHIKKTDKKAKFSRLEVNPKYWP